MHLPGLTIYIVRQISPIYGGSITSRVPISYKSSTRADHNYKYHRRRRRLLPLIIGIVLAVAAIATAAIILVPKLTTKEKTAYLASDSANAVVYYYDDYERRLFRSDDNIQRGTEVIVTNKEYTENGRTYTIIKINGNQYYANKKTLVDSLDKIVQETEKWVRTDVTIYENPEDSRIKSFAKKGTHLEILGYDEMHEDGSINMYNIKMGDVTGWVYSKYLANSQKEADAVNQEYYDIHKDRAFGGSDLYGGSATDLDWFPVEKVEFEGNPLMKDARGMYLNAKAFGNIDEYIEIAKNNGVNTMILDIKDGAPVCHFDIADEMSPTSNKYAFASVERIQEIAQKIKDAGFYLVCRIVVFNDTLYGRDHPEDCIESDDATQLWPSGFSRNVWYYNVCMAEECIEKFGCNEIQFDYVRFPEESYRMSANGNTDFKNKYDEEKAEAIQNFMYYACDEIHKYGVYLSVDVFGECVNGYVTAYGQYFPAISNVVDVISAMPYTDHFGFTVDTWSDPYTTMYDWAVSTAKQQNEVPTPAIARTWLTGYSVPWWHPVIDCDTNYVVLQAAALYDANLPGGFMMWNGSSQINRYYSFAEGWKYQPGDPMPTSVTPREGS